MCRRKYKAKEVTLMNNIRKSNERCYYCGCVVKESKRTIDHKTPLARGGETISENLVMSCQKCNNEKGFLTEEEYREYKEIADIKVSENTVVVTLTAVINSYKDIETDARKEKNRLNNINRKIAKIEATIRQSRFSASDGYKLCKMLQDNLMEREAINNNVRNMQYVRKHIYDTKKSTEDKLEYVKNRIKNDYRKEYVSIKGIELMESV